MVVTVIAILLLLFLIFTGLTVPDPPIDNTMSMEISFGRDNQGMGDVQPEDVSEAESENIPDEVSETNPAPTESVEEVETQNVEETTTIPVETTNTEETDVVVEEPVLEVDPKALYPGNTSNTSSDSQGDTGDQGDQGAEDGSDNTNYSGSHGPGNNFALSGRTLISAPKIVNTSQETGKVVVNIWVDRNGKVIRATPGAKGSTTTSSLLYKIAKAAALKLKYSANSKAAEVQKSTISIDFQAGK